MAGAWLAAALASGCGLLLSPGDETVRGDDAGDDAGSGPIDSGRTDSEMPATDAAEPDAGFDPCVDAPVPETFVLCPFGPPRRLDEVNDPATYDDDPTVTGDLLEMYFNGSRAGGAGGDDLYVTRRAAPGDPWGPPVLVAELVTASHETTPEISSDGLTMHFTRESTVGGGGALTYDIWMTTRADRGTPWSAPVVVEGLSTSDIETGPCVSDDGTVAVLTGRTDPGDWNLFMSVRADRGAGWPVPRPIAELNTAGSEGNAFLDPTLHHLFYDTDLGASRPDAEIVVTTRPSVDAPFGAPVAIDELNSPMHDLDPWVSPDLRYVVFASERDGIGELYEARR